MTTDNDFNNASDIVTDNVVGQQYAGFWIRLFASVIDSVLIMLLAAPLLTAIYGQDYWMDPTQSSTAIDALINYLLPALVIILFWIYRSATPGKMILNIAIVDAKTGGKPSTGQFIGRYLGYYLSMLPLFLGFFWVAFDKRKQGFHDKLAGTLVIHTK